MWIVNGNMIYIDGLVIKHYHANVNERDGVNIETKCKFEYHHANVNERDGVNIETKYKYEILN